MSEPGPGGIAEIADFLCLETINRFEPIFAHLAGITPLHPERLYAARFRSYDADLDAYRFYRLRTNRMKLFDERVLGGGTFVTVRVGPSGRIAWERTERYVGGE